MKYKVGDKVKVISKLTKNRNNYESYFNEEMDMYLGKTMTITDIRGSSYKCKGSYNFKEDNKKYFWSNDMIEGLAQLTKSDLKDNHIVVYKNGSKKIWEKISYKDEFDGNLVHENIDKYSIYEVWEFDKLVWKREILDEVEKKYLSDVIRPFRDRVASITKEKHTYGEKIRIYYDQKTNVTSFMSLPYFEEGTMYKGMELDKEYSLEDLGL